MMLMAMRVIVPSPFFRCTRLDQTWTQVGHTRGLDWVGSEMDWVELG